MNATVTTAVTTITSGGLAAIAAIALLIFLIQKEIVSASSDERAQTLSRALNIAIIPLLLSFVFIAAVEVALVLN